ncbi:MAG: hypothetical protein ACJAYJ_005048 [Saprospiraceae bacterium]|jgi:hypothetical protein
MTNFFQFLACFLLLTVNNLQAQNIVFQDSIFKNKLIGLGVDLNLDNEISMVEAESVVLLNLG